MRASFSVTANLLARTPEIGTWYRALQIQFIPTALTTSYTSTVTSRFSSATRAVPGFAILYLAENHLVALLEAQALLGSPTTPGGLVPHPKGSYATLNVAVSLQQVADLTDPASQTQLDTTAQELTGDWRGYRLRGPGTSVTAPTGMAPTQDLGAALFGVPGLEGFKTLSAKAPDQRVLAIFPQKLLPGSNVSWSNSLTGKLESLS